MKEQEKALLKDKIDKAELISFDIFDTLLFRKTNTPETVFDLVGKHFKIHGFRKLRIDGQNEASRRVWISNRYPHADMDDIYEVLSEHNEIPVDWKDVKAYEIQMERDALTANTELLEIFSYAKEQGKRVVATSDMYLPASLLEKFLKEKGFAEIDHVYCSADEHKAKFNKQLFEVVAQREKVAYEDILHIGDKERDDGEYPASYGIETFIYHRDAELEKINGAVSSEADKGLYKILHNSSKGFWYNLGVEVGGPLYMGLYLYLEKKMLKENKKIYFLSRDGYNLYQLFKKQGFENIEYLYTSRRALTLASIKSMNEKDIENLPPYTYGQTVGEILEYLCIDKEKIRHLEEAGFCSFDDVINTDQDILNFKKLYIFDQEAFLEQCKKERENALEYFQKIGFFDQDSICFDCGWQGSSQELIERFKKAIGSSTEQFFVYFGIKNGAKSRRQLRGLHYDTYLFDFYKNYALQEDVNQNVVLYELFFSAPHESVFYYGKDGKPVFEIGEGDREKQEILDGICDYIQTGLEFVKKYDVEYTPEISVGHLKRLIHFPTEEEAINIGSLQNVDGFARKMGEEKYIAYITKDQLKSNYNEIYWLQGILKRPDISFEVKQECATKMGVIWPTVDSEYHLEDEYSIRTYQRWRKRQGQAENSMSELNYRPAFSVVIPVYNTRTDQLEECIQSVLDQSYENYELILVDDHSSWENVVSVLKAYEKNEKINVIYRNSNGHISTATNDGIFASKGDFIVFMDCDDTIEPNALYEFAKKLNENKELDFLYSDEDKITEDGKINHFPFFKPDWSPDLFLNMMYTNHLAAYRASITKEIGGLRTAYNGSQDYDFTLRFMEKSDNKRVGHIPKILYHWRERKESVAFAMTSKNYASEAARCAKEDYIRRNRLKAYLEGITGMSQYRIVYEVVGNPLVSIIIPSKDQPEILRQCIDSIQSFTNYKNYEIVVVDNGSNEKNKKTIEQYLASMGGEYCYEKSEFNFSKMCNLGAAHSKGEYLLFLNDDIEMFQPEWLERMLGHAQQKHIGAVGAKLFYPQTTKIQHIGISNPTDGPLHSFLTCEDQLPYYFGWNRVDNDCVGVTGACLMLEKKKFDEIHGFDENLAVAYNDVKLCFELLEKGYYNVVRTDVVAYHHESLSRGNDLNNEQKLIRLNRERMELFEKFSDLKNRDPYLNQHLKKWSGSIELKDSYDCLEKIELSDFQSFGTATIDKVNITDKIQIEGWSILEGEDQIEKLDRFVIFKDPYEKIYGAKILPAFRPDVAAHFGQEKYTYAGFECVLRKEDLRIDIMPYQIGVMVIDRNQKQHICWCKEMDIARNVKDKKVVFESGRLAFFEEHGEHNDVQWNIDECQHYDGYFRVRGFAFKQGNDHHHYRSSLILKADTGQAYEVEVQLEERVDVAYSFPNEHFLYYTGFDCYIYNTMLEKGHEYDVLIRLKNQFKSFDIRDIATGRKIRV